LQADASLLSLSERSEIDQAMLQLEKLIPGTDHRAIKKAIEHLNHATEEFAARRMDEGIRRALAGKKIGSL
jgi:molecular chaperone HscA